MNEVHVLPDGHFPGLYAHTEKFLVETEAKFNEQAGQTSSGFLLEHTLRTAAIALKIFWGKLT